MSADCLSFGFNEGIDQYEIIDDDVYYNYKDKKKATSKLLELFNDYIKEDPEFKKINFDKLEVFYLNYSTGFWKYKVQ